jgi:hypothetical protein
VIEPLGEAADDVGTWSDEEDACHDASEGLVTAPVSSQRRPLQNLVRVGAIPLCGTSSFGPHEKVFGLRLCEARERRRPKAMV